jgi:hypothetical protein
MFLSSKFRWNVIKQAYRSGSLGMPAEAESHQGHPSGGIATKTKGSSPMTCKLSKMAVSIAAGFTLLCASSACAAETAQVAVASAGAADVAAAKSETSAIASIVLAGNQRATNLQKTPTAIIVADIASGRKHRVQR